jgi:hypothetical protein
LINTGVKGEGIKVKTWKPTVAGILSIVAGAGGVIVWSLIILGVFIFFIAASSGGGVNLPILQSKLIPVWVAILAIPFMALSILAIVGGVFALSRKIWGLALAGSIGALFCSTVLGIVAIIFTVLSKDEFEPSKSQ